MSNPRFLLEGLLQAGAEVPLPAPAAHHARRVLRLREDAPITLFDGQGNEFAARLIHEPNGSRSWARIGAGGPCDREARVAVTLIQALSALEKIDWMVEKAVEMGVARIVLVPARRSVVQLAGERRERRRARLHDIAVAACCQCGRNRVPDIAIAASLEEGLRAVPDTACRAILDPRAGRGMPAGAAGQVAWAIGPEGGFDEEELALAHRLGYQAVRLGPRVLRTETAGLAALCATLALAGEFGAPATA